MQFRKARGKLLDSLGSELNPLADGTTIAERIIATLNLPKNRLWEYVRMNDLYIPHIVIRTAGPVDRSEHYYIYEDPHPRGFDTPNLLVKILECAGDFEPKWLKRQEASA